MGRKPTTKIDSAGLRFILIGAPGLNKGKIMRSLVRSHGLEGKPSLTDFDDYAIGRLADYRIEAKLASDRCYELAQTPKRATIFEHSLIDSLSYCALRAMEMASSKAVDEYTQEKWAALTVIISSFIRDTFYYDHLFFFVGSDEKDLEVSYISVLEAFGLPYSLLDGNYQENLIAVTQTIEGYLNGSSVTDPE